MHSFRKAVPYVCLIILAMQVLVEIVPGPPPLRSLATNSTQVVAGLFAVVCAGLEARRRKGYLRRFWYLTGFSFAIFTVAMGLWIFRENYLRLPVTANSLTEVLFFFAIAPFLYALLLDEAKDAAPLQWVELFAFGQMGLAVLGVYLDLFYIPSSVQGFETRRLVGYLYILRDIAVVSALLVRMAATRSRVLRRLFASFCGVFLVGAFGEVFFYMSTRSNSMDAVGWFDLGYTLPSLLVAYISVTVGPEDGIRHVVLEQPGSSYGRRTLFTVFPLLSLVLFPLLTVALPRLSLLMLVLSFGMYAAQLLLSERELDRSLSRLRATLESTADGILVVDRNGKIVDYNRRFQEIWHIPDETLVPHEDQKAIDAGLANFAEPEKFMARVAEIYAHPNQESFDSLEFKDGTLIERYSRPQRIGSEIEGRVWSFRDVTERQQLEDQFRRSQKMEAMGRLAAGVAHDFNNLLTVIQGYSEVIRDSRQLSGSMQTGVEQIYHAAQRAAGLTRQLLAFSRKQTLALQVMDLNEAIKHTGLMLKRLIGSNIELIVTAPEDLGKIKADPGQIEQVILNLAVNARDAMPNGGKLIFEISNVTPDQNYAIEDNGRKDPSTKAPSGYVMLAVTDTGTGMDEVTRARIFEPFFTTKAEGKGSGLGLATVYGIVQQSNGHISVESEVGKGTIFRIYLPRTDSAVTATPKSTATLAPQGSETILLVDDDEAVRVLAREFLTQLGYNVLVATNGEDAVKTEETYSGTIHLLLTDLVMPNMNGRQLAEHAARRWPNVRVVYMSGYAGDTIAQNWDEEMGTAYLEKPFDLATLAQKVRQALEQEKKTD